MRTQKRSQWRDVHGVVLLDKPQGLSSNQALQKVRRLFSAAKAGHTGSLDPLATGLLPICLGEATKIAGLLLGSQKAYVTECLLGVTTDSADAEGEVLLTRPVPVLDSTIIEQALVGLRGRISQVPPIYSALKRDGVPLYRLARRGEVVDVPAREVEVHAFELLAIERDVLRLQVTCGSGTYVRSLVRDLGEALGCGAHVTALRRLWVAPFHAPRMYTLEELEQVANDGRAALDALLLPLEAGLSDHAHVSLDATQALHLGQGRSLALDLAPGNYLAYDDAQRLLALAEVAEDGVLRVVRGFNL
ncbi:MAG: tRNA pseudouridine(55) synthase TruB [Dokdonella sp.]